MQAMSVGRKDWKRFAAEFTRKHEGWPLVIEMAGGTQRDQPELEPVPFRGITLDDRRSQATLVLGEEPDAYFTHSIDGVNHVILESGLKRSERSIRLESEDGEITLLHFELTDVGELV